MTLKSMAGWVAAPLFIILLAGPAIAAEKYVYPTKGQSEDRTEKDKYECYAWAKKQTGVDPAQPSQASSSRQDRPVLKGAARGTAVGVVGGAIAGDVGKGAAIGATSGALIGGMRHRDQAAREADAAAAGQDSYDRAYSACLEGRGYSVK